MATAPGLHVSIHGHSASPVWKSEPKELPLSFQTEPIIAWRAWQLGVSDRYGGVTEPRLHSVGVNGVWLPRKRMEALCTPHNSPWAPYRAFDGHEAPWPDCMCGLWGFATAGQLEAATSASHSAGCVVGRVSLWGRVLECENGYRAQYGYPLDLTIIGGGDEQAADLARVYGVPVTTKPAEEYDESDLMQAALAELAARRGRPDRAGVRGSGPETRRRRACTRRRGQGRRASAAGRGGQGGDARVSGVAFVAFGQPRPAGSKSIGRARDGRAFIRDSGKGGGGVAEWKRTISQAAGSAMNGHGLLDGPLELVACFYLPRPKGHFGKRGLLPSAPARPTVKPDATKLLRGCEDALIGVVFRDDSQIVDQRVTKHYGEPARVQITVRPITERSAA